MLISDVAAHSRLLNTGHPAARPLRTLLAGDAGEIPAALIEPARSGLVSLGAVSYDVRVSIAAKMGLPIAGPAGPPTAPGWTFGPSPEGWELIDPTMTLIARCKVAPETAQDESSWASQAAVTGHALIVYGTQVGVRLPGGVKNRSYDDQARAQELAGSLTAGTACAAMVELTSNHVTAGYLC
jgi:hypothetical protein